MSERLDVCFMFYVYISVLTAWLYNSNPKKGNVIQLWYTVQWDAARWNRRISFKHTIFFLPQLQTPSQIDKTVALNKTYLTKYFRITTNHNMLSYFQF